MILSCSINLGYPDDVIGTQSCSTNRCVQEHSPGLHPVQVSEIGTHIVDSGTLMELGLSMGLTKEVLVLIDSKNGRLPFGFT